MLQYSVIDSMVQLKKQTTSHFDRHSYSSTPLRRGTLPPHEELIARGELQRILQGFAQREEELRCTITELQTKNGELQKRLSGEQSAKHEFQRCRHLLSIKEQVVIAQQREIQELKAALNMKQTKERQGRGAKWTTAPMSLQDSDLNDVSKIETVMEDSADKENRGYQTKRKICLKKSIKNNIGGLRPNKTEGATLALQGQKLQIARLKSEISKLKGTIQYLQTQVMIGEIEMEHIGKQCELTSKRERRLYELLMKFLRESGCRNEQEGVLGQKCEMLESYIDKLTEKLERAEQPGPKLHFIPPSSFRKGQEVPPPITPHFSNGSTFIFPNTKRTPTKIHQPVTDEIFQAVMDQDEPPSPPSYE